MVLTSYNNSCSDVLFCRISELTLTAAWNLLKICNVYSMPLSNVSCSVCQLCTRFKQENIPPCTCEHVHDQQTWHTPAPLASGPDKSALDLSLLCPHYLHCIMFILHTHTFTFSTLMYLRDVL